MESLWNEDDAARCVAHYAGQGIAETLALRVYTTRLLGGDPRLVLHGGGNTSLKTRMTDLAGEELEVLCVKGSGWDMAAIEPAGIPALRLAPLRRLQSLDALADTDMVNVLRGNLLDAEAPNPSVETLLHAFLPQQFVDHTHANAVLAVADQPDGEAICAELYDGRAGVVTYVMSGLALAKKAAEVQAAHPEAAGLILLKHGVVSFGATARESYERMVELVSLAERRLARGERKSFGSVSLPARLAAPAEVAPVLRGLLAIETDAAEGLFNRFVLTFRSGDRIRAFVDGAELERYSHQGVATPDHSIRIKTKPLVLPAPAADDPEGFVEAAGRAMADYRAAYEAYFARNDARLPGARTRRDSSPRVILVPGLGLFAAGENAKAAAIAADLAEANIEVIAEAEAIGRFESISEAEAFAIEYWSLEQAKLGTAKEPPLARHVVAVTGGGGAIGAATAAAFRAAGAEVALLDLDAAPAEAAAERIGGLGLACDVTDRSSVEAAFARVAETYGGLDILVSNAGAAWQGMIGDISDRELRESFELNFFAHQSVAQCALAIMRAQKTGGVLLFNASKQAVNPGANFGAYGLPKAATMALCRQYALEYGAEGIRANAVNADRIRSGLLTGGMIEARSKARGVSEDTYMRGNLLKREVTAEDVAAAFVDLALARKTTGAVLTVDGGNIAAALR